MLFINHYIVLKQYSGNITAGPIFGGFPSLRAQFLAKNPIFLYCIVNNSKLKSLLNYRIKIPRIRSHTCTISCYPFIN